MIRLYIEGKEIELDESTRFAITKQFEELSNPTTIINDWSKTVSIPFTHTNNIIFGHIYCPDKMIVDGGTTGVYFNPLLKLDFRLEWNSTILMTGYAKMNEVKQNNGRGSYEITLFGQLGKIFQEMKKITFDTTTEDTEYLIDDSLYVSTHINQSLVSESWNSRGQTSSKLKGIRDSGYKVTDIIGFAPNNSFSEGFNYDTYQTRTNSSNTFVNALGDSFTADTGISPDTIIPNGMLPREIGEYRSYLQLPFIYWNKLFQIFQAKAESITGYQFELDSEWFNQNNPYWFNLVYMLNPLSPKTKEIYTNYYYTLMDDNIFWGTSSFTTSKTNSFMALEDSNESYPILNAYRVTPMTLSINNDYSIRINSDFKFGIQFKSKYSSGVYHPTTIADGQGLAVTFKITNDAGTAIKDYKMLICNKNYSKDTSTYDEVFKMGESTHVDGTYDYFYITPHISRLVTSSEIGDGSVKFYVEAHWLLNTAPLVSDKKTYAPSIINFRDFGITTIPFTVEVLVGDHHSNSYFSLNDLWNNDYNLFDEILKYCKMYRISISVDEYGKKIMFKPYTKYFDNYTVSDWTNKIDKSKDYIITPITLENKYILFNYDDNKTKLAEHYKEKYGVNFAEYRLTTEYNFNTDTKKLFDKVKTSIVNTDNVLSWENIYTKHSISYSFPSEIFIYNKDKDNNQVDTFGSFYFHNGLAEFSTEESLNLRPVYISDDTVFQQGNNNFFYTQMNDKMTRTYYYPKLDVIYGDHLCLFNTPKENYTYISNYSNKNTIYTNFWQSYLDERYNVQNKKITCYVQLKPADYCSFEFNKLVKIGNQLCLVNKIYDYDITENGTTKVDLITIQDISAYTNTNFADSIDTLSLSWNTTSYFNSYTGSQHLLGSIDTVTEATFDNGSTEYTANGVTFSIKDNKVYYQVVEPYYDSKDIDFNVTIKNHNYTTSFTCQRYSIHPYPHIVITDSNGNELTTLGRGPQSYTLSWYGTETEGSDKAPTVSYTIQGTGTVNIGSTWSESEAIIQDGDNEYFRNKYSTSLNINLSTGMSITFTITDAEGWHETKTYSIS